MSAKREEMEVLAALTARLDAQQQVLMDYLTHLGAVWPDSPTCARFFMRRTASGKFATAQGIDL